MNNFSMQYMKKKSCFSVSYNTFIFSTSAPVEAVVKEDIVAPSMTQKPKAQTVNENETVHFECKLVAKPEPEVCIVEYLPFLILKLSNVWQVCKMLPACFRALSQSY